MEHIGHDWRQLGQQLGLSKSDLDCIEDDNQYLRDRIYDLFYQWKRRNGLHATVKQLKAAVLNSNLGYLLGYLGKCLSQVATVQYINEINYRKMYLDLDNTMNLLSV